MFDYAGQHYEPYAEDMYCHVCGEKHPDHRPGCPRYDKIVESRNKEHRASVARQKSKIKHPKVLEQR